MRPFQLATANEPGDVSRCGPFDEQAELTVGSPVQFLATGTNLLDLMKLDVMTPKGLIDIGPLAARHSVIESSEDGLTLGAFAHMADAAPHVDLCRDYPVIAQSLWMAASRQLRNMATLRGNVCSAHAACTSGTRGDAPATSARGKRLRSARRRQSPASRARRQRTLHRQLSGAISRSPS
jgi:xanthine dehydrogenase iron-sulfur cluster and FAD-binding subunit A